MIASASMLLANPAGNQPIPKKGMFIMGQGQGAGGMGMKKSCKAHCKSMKGKFGPNMQKKMMKRKMKRDSPFLIKHGLPHLTKMIMPYINDPAFNLTEKQKQELMKVRKTTMTAVMEAKQKVKTLRREIVKSSQAGVSADADQLKDKVVELALVEAAATMTHLKCIEATKAILTKDQMYFLLANKNKKMNHGKNKMMRMKKTQGQGMKCRQGMGK